MKLHRLFPIFLIMLMIGLASCDTTRRASRRIRNIVQEHPELLSQDTMQCDVNISVTPPSDSTTFSLGDFDIIYDNNNDIIMDNDTTPAVITPPTITHKTESGTFTIEKTGDEEFKVTYKSDTLQVETTAEVVVPKLVIEQEHKTSLAEVIKWLAIGIIVVLFARLFLMKVK